MWRRGVVAEQRRPAARQRDGLKDCPRHVMRRREMKRRLLNTDGVEPYDMAGIGGELSVVVTVAARMVRLEVPMNCRVRVIGVGFVHVLWYKRR